MTRRNNAPGTRNERRVPNGAEENKAKFMRVVDEAWNKGDLAVLREVIAPGYVYQMASQQFKGPDGLGQAITMFRTAMPDFKLQVNEVIAEGDRVAALYTVTGTLTGEFMGIPATGKRLVLDGAGFFQYRDGKEVKAATFVDQLSMFQQLGIKPPMT